MRDFRKGFVAVPARARRFPRKRVVSHLLLRRGGQCEEINAARPSKKLCVKLRLVHRLNRQALRRTSFSGGRRRVSDPSSGRAAFCGFRLYHHAVPSRQTLKQKMLAIQYVDKMVGAVGAASMASANSCINVDVHGLSTRADYEPVQDICRPEHFESKRVTASLAPVY